jgi:hypothetical protein
LGHCTSCGGYFEINHGGVCFESNKMLLVLVWRLECCHYHMHEIVGWFNCQAMWVLHLVYGTIDDELEILDGHMDLQI